MSILERSPPKTIDMLDLSPLDDLPDDQRAEFLERLEQSFECASMRAQLALLYEPYPTLPRPSYQNLADIFRVSGGTVHKHVTRHLREVREGPRGAGRPPLLSKEELRPILDRITERYYAKEIVTYPMIAEWIDELYSKRISPNTIGAMLKKLDETQSVEAPVMEDKRYECDTESIDIYFRELARLVDGKPAMLVANLDEMGYMESQDKHAQTVIIPKDADPRTVRVPVDRSSRRFTILQCIFADGTSARPAVVVPRKTGDQELLDLGIYPTHCLIYFQENGFMTSEIFLDWTLKELVPEFQRRIERVLHLDVELQLGLTDEQRRGLLIMDGLKQHFTDYIEDITFENCVDLLQLPSHSSDQTQPCDLCVFAVCKTLIDRAIGDGVHKQTKEVSKVVSAMHAACTPANIRKSFRRAGITVYWHGDVENGILLCAARLEDCTAVRHFQRLTEEQRRSSYRDWIAARHAGDPASPGATFTFPKHYATAEMKPNPAFQLAWNADRERFHEQSPVGDPCPDTREPFHSQWLEVLAEEFPEGTDKLRSDADQERVKQWTSSRPDDWRVPRRGPPAAQEPPQPHHEEEDDPDYIPDPSEEEEQEAPSPPPSQETPGVTTAQNWPQQPAPQQPAVGVMQFQGRANVTQNFYAAPAQPQFHPFPMAPMGFWQPPIFTPPAAPFQWTPPMTPHTGPRVQQTARRTRPFMRVETPQPFSRA